MFGNFGGKELPAIYITTLLPYTSAILPPIIELIIEPNRTISTKTEVASSGVSTWNKLKNLYGRSKASVNQN